MLDLLPVSFATELEKHVARLGIAESCAALEITRRTLEQWRAGREPRQIVQRGALVILSETRPKTKKAAPGPSNNPAQTPEGRSPGGCL